MKSSLNNNYVFGLVTENKEPSLYQLLVHNDDYTPMDFVIGLLEKIFLMDRRKATETTLEAHLKGKASCGVYSKDVAVTKMHEVVEYARRFQHPLNCSMETT